MTPGRLSQRRAGNQVETTTTTTTTTGKAKKITNIASAISWGKKRFLSFQNEKEKKREKKTTFRSLGEATDGFFVCFVRAISHWPARPANGRRPTFCRDSLATVEFSLSFLFCFGFFWGFFFGQGLSMSHLWFLSAPFTERQVFFLGFTRFDWVLRSVTEFYWGLIVDDEFEWAI